MVQRPFATAALLALACGACEGSGNAPSADASSHAAQTSPPPVASSGPNEPPIVLAPEYRGTIGDDGTVVARLFVDGSRVTGTYFYEKEGTAKALAGSAKGGHVALDETVDGAKSAALALDLAADGAIGGTWTGPQGEKRVHLEAIVPAPQPKTALLFKRVVHATKPARDAKSKDDVCKTTVTYVEAYGLPPSIEAKLNADLAPAPELALREKCEHALEVSGEYRVAHNADGILSVRVTSLVTEAQAATKTRSGRAVTVLLASAARVKLFGDVVKPKAERTFESALGAEVGALVRKHHLDAAGRNALDQALAFSPPFVLDDAGVHLFADALAPAYAEAGSEGVVVRYATLPRPVGPVAVMWGK